MKKTIGILAHVDAGKTTFSEQVLFRTGALRAVGRVDHGSAFMDHDPIERQRGITIFSDQTTFTVDNDRYFWLDTPGHVDFSPEMERVIQAMDYAIVLVSCAEGVQSHTETVWHLLEKHHVPVFLFINKTDRTGADRAAVLAQIKRLLSYDAVDMEGYAPGKMPEPVREAVAERSEAMLERLLADEFSEMEFEDALVGQISRREIFPVFSGAALTGTGMDEFLKALFALSRTDYDEDAPFSARVYKIRHDPQGATVCFFKVMSGKISVLDELPQGRITELREYRGGRFTGVRMASAGELCAAVGLSGVRVGVMLGAGGGEVDEFSCEPMLASSLELPDGLRVDDALRALRELEQEEPTLSVETDKNGIAIRVMGEIQLEVLREVLKKRYNMDVSFGKRRVIFMETIQEPVIGIGHYEPLRHYAEVHLRLVPGSRGSGITFESKCHVDDLSLNWQRLIETHVFEKHHKGVLTGSQLTDVKVQLLAGRDHLKHTEGGDFREATYRAIRNALMNAKCVLMEPICAFELRAPADNYGRIMGDLTRMRADCDIPRYSGETVEISGQAAFREISGYGIPLTALTHGRGVISYRLDHFEPVRDAESVIAEFGYDPCADDSPDSVFCQKGAGFVVNWKDVPSYAHIPQEYNI